MDIRDFALLAAGLLVWIAIVYAALAMGLRRGDLVWAGRSPRLLSAESRWHSALYAIFLVAAAAVIAGLAGYIDFGFVPERWHRSVGFAATAFLGVAAIVSIGWGSRWERLLFGPLTLIGALMAGYLTFA